jgi:ABC-type spermidine/putrescine transport system permease subunit II
MSIIAALLIAFGAFVLGFVAGFLILRNNPKVKKALDTGVDYVETLKK